MKNKLVVLIVILFFSFIASGSSDSDLDTLNDYSGDIGGKYKIGMTLVYNGNDVSGVYFYNKYLKDIKITGKIFEGNKIILKEYDKNNKIVAVFDGKFTDFSEITGKITNKIIAGRWKRADKNMNMKFYLEFFKSMPRQKGYGRYGTFEMDKVIEKSAQSFCKAVKNNDSKKVAEFIKYPIKAKFDGKWRKIENKRELIKNYNKIFTPSFRLRIISSVPHNMNASFSYHRTSGVMLGDGEIWFGFDGKVKIINN